MINVPEKVSEFIEKNHTLLVDDQDAGRPFSDQDDEQQEIVSSQNERL